MDESRLNKPLVNRRDRRRARARRAARRLRRGVVDRMFGGPGRQDHRHVEPGIDARAEPADRVRRALRFGSAASTSRSAALSTERTLILPGDVRYELDLRQACSPRTCAGTQARKTLRVRLPEIEIAGPEVDLAAAREYGEGGVLSR